MRKWGGVKKRKLDTEMDGLRRSMAISRIQHLRNTNVRTEMDAKVIIVVRIDQR